MSADPASYVPDGPPSYAIGHYTVTRDGEITVTLTNNTVLPLLSVEGALDLAALLTDAAAAAEHAAARQARIEDADRIRDFHAVRGY